ncbi:MAG: spermidine/putrescine ABC transporter substrate-binding protein [Nocardioidaceae bacterium]
MREPAPLTDEIRQLLARAPVGRRGLLRGAGLAGLGLGAPSLLSACGTKAAKQTTASCVSKDLSSSQKTLHVSNWPLYLDEKKVKRGGKKVTVFPTLVDFEKQSGIQVDYVADVNGNSEFFGIVRNQLAACQATGRDIMVLTDWMAARMVNLGWLQKVDKAKTSNVAANLVPNLKSPSWDKNRDYSAPWQSGLTGIAYNAKLTKEVRSFQELLTRPDLKGKVSLLSEMHDTMLFMLLLEGADPENFTSDQFGTAIERLKKASDAGQIRAFTGNEYAQDLAKGNIVACEAWSGDVIQLQFDNPDIKFVAPEEGLALWSDNILIPNKSEHKANAEALMNYYYQPEVAATLAAWVNYICPVAGAKQAMEKIDSTLVDNKLIFPDEGTLSKAKDFMGLDQKTEQGYQKQFASVTGA